MSRLDCTVVRDLMPLYVEQLTSEETDNFIKEHIESCESCKQEILRMNQSLEIKVEAPKPNKKLLRYVNWVRMWYFICPTIAFVTYLINYKLIFRGYIGLLALLSVICLSSYMPGISYGIDYEQVKLSEESKQREVNRWGIYRVSPFSLCLPAIIVIIIYCAMSFGNLEEILRVL